MTALSQAKASILFPWGNRGESLAVSPPEAWPGAEVFWPDLSEASDDKTPTLSGALDSPLGSPRLETLVKAGAKVAIVVDDPSRWTPVREALPTILGRLHASGVRVEDVCIVAGVGRHHAVDHEAMRGRVGDDVAARYSCFSPPVDDLSAYTDLGATSRNVPVRVFRAVAEADLRILIGSVLPHLSRQVPHASSCGGRARQHRHCHELQQRLCLRRRAARSASPHVEVEARNLRGDRGERAFGDFLPMPRCFVSAGRHTRLELERTPRQHPGRRGWETRRPEAFRERA